MNARTKKTSRKLLPPLRTLERLARQEGYRPGHVGRRLGLRGWELRRKFHRSFHCCPEAWLQALRLRDVEALLARGELEKNALDTTHFKHLSSFSRWLKLHRHPAAFPAAGKDAAIRAVATLIETPFFRQTTALLSQPNSAKLTQNPLLQAQK
ncbi:MAG: hypothetical protein C5B50_13600 [Verrucomicrobia bacterium]|nr:MAG: hypothetical protein C5B50_13600 [Verrucomicrobiota bacterium]